MYFILGALYCVAYAFFVLAIPFCITDTVGSVKDIRPVSLVTIAVLCLVTFGISFVIPNDFWANRWLHAVGGGMTGFILYWLAVRDSHTSLNTTQFFVLGFLLVTALGVANELMEMILQLAHIEIAAATVTDTWFDLASNTVGATLTGLVVSYKVGPCNNRTLKP